MFALTGPPKLNGLTLPYAEQSRAVDVQWADESIYSRRRSLVVRREARFRMRSTWGYIGLTPDVAYQIQSIITDASSVLVTPRSKLPSDPDWATEAEIECRLSSPLTGLASPATGLVSLMMEVEATGTLPGQQLLSGGFRLSSVAGNEATIQTYGDARFEQAPPVEVVLFGQTYTITTARPYPAGLAALNIQEVRQGGQIKRTTFASYLTIPTE